MASIVIREQGSRLPYRWKIGDELGRGRIVIWGAFGVWVCGSINVRELARKQPAWRKGIRQTSNLGLRLLGSMALGESGRCKGSEGSDEPARGKNEHDKDSGKRLKERVVFFECWTRCWRRGRN